MYFQSRDHVFSGQGMYFSVKRAGHVFSVNKACMFIQDGRNSESLCVVNLAADFVAHKTLWNAYEIIPH